MTKDINPYEVLGVDTDATVSTIKKAYHRLCLKFHPDKNDGFRREFDDVQLAYLTLGDEAKRKIYDTTGALDGQGDAAGMDWDWKFAEVTKEMIEKDRMEYQGSKEEEDDVFSELQRLDGDMEKLFEVVLHLEFSKSEEERMFKLCEKIIAEHDLTLGKWNKYVTNRSKIVEKMEKRRIREAKAAAKMDKSGDDGPSDMASLQAMILGNKQRSRSAMDDIIDKYSKPQKKKGVTKPQTKKPKRKN